MPDVIVERCFGAEFFAAKVAVKVDFFSVGVFTMLHELILKRESLLASATLEAFRFLNFANQIVCFVKVAVVIIRNFDLAFEALFLLNLETVLNLFLAFDEVENSFLFDVNHLQVLKQTVFDCEKLSAKVTRITLIVFVSGNPFA